MATIRKSATKEGARGRRVIFVTGDKGGAGKTTVARYLLDQARRSGATVAAYDGDGAVGQLLQYHGTRDAENRLVPDQDPTVGVRPYDIRSERQRDLIIDAIDSGAITILHDLPGGVSAELEEIGGLGAVVEEYRGEGFAVTVVIVTTPMFASAVNVRRTVEAVEGAADFVVVRSLFAGDADDFKFLDEGQGRRLVEERGGVIVNFPKLRAYEYALLDHHSLPYSAAVESAELSRSNRAMIRAWIQTTREELTPVLPALGLTGG